MGMFDHVLCEHPLPDGYEIAADDAFQTKSFADPWLAWFKIKADGTLWKLEHLPLPDPHESDVRWCPSYHTGEVLFCDIDQHGKIGVHEDSTWHEYRAVFENGRLVGEIEDVSHPQ